MSARGSAAYRIVDEPVPSAYQHLVVASFWPLLAGMLGGLWLGLPWFLFNAYAMGSATKIKETIVAGVALASVLLTAFIMVLIFKDQADRSIRFAVLLLQLLKLGAYYTLSAMQSRSFELHRYYGGAAKNGFPVVIAGAVLRGAVLDLVGGSTVAVLVLS